MKINTPNLKLIFLSLFFLYTNIEARPNEDEKKAAEIRQMMWDDADVAFQQKEIPEEWKNKPAVIIAKSNVLSYKKDPIVVKLRCNKYYHERIMLLNSTTLEDYAQFDIPESGSYRKTSFDFYTGFKIIKPDGKEIIVSMDNAVREEKKINEHGLNMLKLAIPNLEVGDILDYYVVEEQVISAFGTYYQFDPVLYQIYNKYPVMKQIISFDVQRRCFINLKLLNSDSKFEEKEDTDTNKKTYHFEDNNRESVDDIRWMFPYRELPTVKFKVIYASPSVEYYYYPGFLGNSEELNTNVSKKEISSLVGKIFENSSFTLEKNLKHFLKKNYKGGCEPEKLFSIAYDFIRHHYHVYGLEYYSINGRRPGSSSASLIALSDFLKSNNIEHDILIGIPREISDIDDLILEQELIFGLKVHFKEPLYVTLMDENSIYGEISQHMQGISVYSVDGLKESSDWDLEKVSIPVDIPERNGNRTFLKMKVDDLENDSIRVDMVKTITGASKEYYQEQLMDVFDFHDDENPLYLSYDAKRDYSSQTGYEEKFLKNKTEYADEKEEKLNKDIKDLVVENYDFEIGTVENFKLLEKGRSVEKPNFKYNCSFMANGTLKKAGNNFLFDIGKFIESQVELTQEEKDKREFDIYMPYARSFVYDIEFQIPDGYSLEGADKLNFDVSNKTGKFESTATVEGNVLKIRTTKAYNSNFEKKEDWPLMVEFLDAAFKFSNTQVLLKKM